MASLQPGDEECPHVCSNFQQKLVKINTPAGRMVQSPAFKCADCSMMYVSQDKAERLQGEVAPNIKNMMPVDVDKTDVESSNLLNVSPLDADIQDCDVGHADILLTGNLPGGSSNSLKVETDCQPTVYSCRRCAKTMLFASLSSLMEHYKQIHKADYAEDIITVYNCSKCNRQFTSETDLTQHAGSGECQDGGPFFCKYCQKTFQSTTADDFQYHVLQCANFSSDNAATHFECSQCGINFVRHQQLVEHHRQQHMGEKVFKCEHCDAKFSWQENLERHVKIHEDDESSNAAVTKEVSRVLCRVCSNPFHSVVSLSSHMSLSHPDHPFTRDGSWGIEPGTDVRKRKRKILVAKSQPMLKLIDNAADVDTDLSEFVAELAAASSKQTEEDASLEPPAKLIKQEHVAVAESISESNPVMIEEEEDLGVHKLLNAVAAQNDPHSLYCNTCEKTYQNLCGDDDAGTSMSLRCMHCGWTFQEPFQLEAHLEHLHTTHIRMSICKICSSQLKNNTAMDKHYAGTHPESRVFHCYQCDSHFNTKSCLRGHLLRHQQQAAAALSSSSSSSVSASRTTGDQHACPHCNMRYAHAHQLLTHVTKSHPAFVPRSQSLLGSATAGAAVPMTVPIPGAAGLGNTKFICGFCSKKFAYEGSLKIHLKSHEEKIKAHVLSLEKRQ